MTPHIEKHFTARETVRDIVIGMSDGLTVPSALAAGYTCIKPWRGGFQTMLIGGLAACAAFLIAQIIS